MLWLVLAAVRRLATNRPGRAGVLLGLGLLSRTAAVLYLVPLTLLLLRQGRWRDAARFAAGTVATTTFGLLPFLLADRQDTLYSLLSFRATLPVGGGSVWGLTLGTPLEVFGRQHDSAVVLVAALALTLGILAARHDLTVASRDVYALL